jgi:hypothetical protein
MTDLVGLLYRADWTRLSLAAEVSVRRDLDLDRTRYGPGMPPGEFGKFGEFGEGVPPPWQIFREARKPPWARHTWEMATDQLGRAAGTPSAAPCRGPRRRDLAGRRPS